MKTSAVYFLCEEGLFELLPDGHLQKVSQEELLHAAKRADTKFAEGLRRLAEAMDAGTEVKTGAKPGDPAPVAR